jgi:AcrR family transcriptional regulator
MAKKKDNYSSIIIRLRENSKLCLRDPEETDLGRSIISNSIILIDKLGFEEFTFKKLAAHIGSTEASIYRYFENKHKLLVYLVSWYWAWLEYRIDYNTNNVGSACDRLKIIIQIISESSQDDPGSPHINENILHRIVISEASKVYLTKHVDLENKEGLFANYSSLCKKISDVITEVKPSYPHPRALASNLIETALEQSFFSEHLPSLTDIRFSKNSKGIREFVQHIVFSALGK